MDILGTADRCPVGALIERPDWHHVMRVLDSKQRVTVVQTAPATRVAIGEEFGLAPGTVPYRCGVVWWCAGEA
jgi:NADH dehydrogenase/NADH:ubiquinone oxidoreductase subunit G